jgi:hypothetical protein
MKEDAREELERLEQELLADMEDPSMTDDELMAALDLEAPDAEPDVDAYITDSEEFSEELEEEEAPSEAPVRKRRDGLTIGLMITACFLCLGIIGVMIYWLEMFL